MQVAIKTDLSHKNNICNINFDSEVLNSTGTSICNNSVQSQSARHSRCFNKHVDFRHNEIEKGSGDGFKDYDNPSFIDGLLFEIYDRWNNTRSRDSFDSDTFTEYSSTSEFVSRNAGYKEEWEKRYAGQLRRAFLETKSTDQLELMAKELRHSIAVMSARIVRQLKHRDRRLTKLNRHNDVITAILQASSLKRRIDTRMKFSIAPCAPGESAFHQWRDAMRAVARLPSGIPNEFRKTVWLNLADQYITSIQVDWERTLKFVFNERSNPDDHILGVQIVKDLHRTGCGGYSGMDNEEDRAILKRVLLAYARWNKTVGYCQGFNVIAALLLNVTESREDHALKVMIYLIDYVIPNGYFANNLRALSVDMAVFRDMLLLKFPKLSRHLDYLQHSSDGKYAGQTGPNYEPPLTNVFTMQWFLTLFATCLPKYIVLRIWDCVLLEGSEILLRSALIIWSQLSSHMMSVESADEFYTVMGYLCQDLMEGRMCNADDMVKCIYELGPFPFPHLTELREKYTYNITPFSAAVSNGGGRKSHSRPPATTFSDDDDLDDDDDIAAITCFNGSGDHSGYQGDISTVGPGAYGVGLDSIDATRSLYEERMTTDIGALKKQYCRLKHRQAQAHIILASVSARQNSVIQPTITTTIESPVAMNHLFINKDKIKNKNRFVTTLPFIASEYPKNSDVNVPFGESPDQTPGYGLMTEAVQGAVEREFRGRTNSTVSEMSEYSATSVMSEERRRDESRSPASGRHSDHSDHGNHGDSAIMKECEPMEKLILMDSMGSGDETVAGGGGSGANERNDEVGDANTERLEDPRSSSIESNASKLDATSDTLPKSDTSPTSEVEIKPAVESVAVIEQTNINTASQKCENVSKYQKTSPIRSKSVTIEEHRRTNEERNVENTAIFLYQAHKRRQTRTVPTSAITTGSSSSSQVIPDSPTKPRPYNPFPIRHVNSHRAANGLKLGLYTPEVLQAYSNVQSFNKAKVPLSKTKKFFSVS